MVISKQAQSVLDKHDGAKRSRGQVIADAVVQNMGSWRFIIIQTGFVILWITLNLIGIGFHWDVYPFILLNLLFSTQAAYASPLILMSGNRSAVRDHDFAEHQFQEIELIRKLLDENTKLTDEVHTAMLQNKDGK